MVFPYETLRRLCIFVREWFYSLFLPWPYVGQLSIHHYELEYCFALSMHYVNMDWLVLIRIEKEYKPKIFKYLWHMTVFFCYSR